MFAESRMSNVERERVAAGKRLIEVSEALCLLLCLLLVENWGGLSFRSIYDRGNSLHKLLRGMRRANGGRKKEERK